MIGHDGRRLALDFFSRKPVHVEVVQEHLNSDSGLMLFRQWDEQRGFTADFAAQLNDPRREPEHSLLEMVRSRLFGVLAGYEDPNDHDRLRGDALFKLLAGRLPDEGDLASQPTLSRFKNSVSPPSLLRREAWLLEQFVASFDEPPQEITLDIDVFDDPTHGQQQLTFFHGCYGQYQYLVRVITCAENDRVVLPVLLHGTARPALGAEEDLERVAGKLRERFPDVRIRLRADSHLRHAPPVPVVRASGDRVHDRPGHERRAEAGKRGIAGSRNPAVQSHGRASAAFRRLRVSGRLLVPAALGGGQVRSAPAGDQPPRGGRQSA